MTPTTNSRPPATALSWAILAAVVASMIFVSLLIGPLYAVIGGFWLVCAWAAFWLIRLAVRYGVNDALQSNREWLGADARKGIAERDAPPAGPGV